MGEEDPTRTPLHSRQPAYSSWQEVRYRSGQNWSTIAGSHIIVVVQAGRAGSSLPDAALAKKHPAKRLAGQLMGEIRPI